MPPPDEKQRLGERLRQQALADRPVFSAELHQQLYTAVRSQWADKPAEATANSQPLRPLPTARRSPRWRFILVAVGAAVVLGGVAIGGWLFSGSRDRPESGSTPRTPSHDRTTASTNQVPTTTAVELAAIEALLNEANAQLENMVKQTADWPTRHRPESVASAALQAITERVPFDAVLVLVANGSEPFAPMNNQP